MALKFFIKYGIAQSVASRMRYLGENVNEAAGAVVENLREVGGGGGVIALDKYGNGKFERWLNFILDLCNNWISNVFFPYALVAMPFNTSGMYRGYIRVSDGIPYVYIF